MSCKAEETAARKQFSDTLRYRGWEWQKIHIQVGTSEKIKFKKTLRKKDDFVVSFFVIKKWLSGKAGTYPETCTLGIFLVPAFGADWQTCRLEDWRACRLAD